MRRLQARLKPMVSTWEPSASFTASSAKPGISCHGYSLLPSARIIIALTAMLSSQKAAEQHGHAHGLSRHPFRQKGAPFLNNNLRLYIFLITHSPFRSVGIFDRTRERSVCRAYKIESTSWPTV